MNTQVTQIYFTIIKLRRAIGTNPEAELAADALILVNQGYAGLAIFIKGRAGTGFDTGRIKAMQAGNRLEVLVDPVIDYLGPNLIYPDQFRTCRITNRWCYRMGGQTVLQFTGHYARVATDTPVFINEDSPGQLLLLRLINFTE
jgi:hypothetical protein